MKGEAESRTDSNRNNRFSNFLFSIFKQKQIFELFCLNSVSVSCLEPGGTKLGETMVETWLIGVKTMVEPMVQ